MLTARYIRLYYQSLAAVKIRIANLIDAPAKPLGHQLHGEIDRRQIPSLHPRVELAPRHPA
ncbi:hypothetical protein [Sphingopyxis sp.]|uniref:hypothetical protein n=1 Tax=Sphingopyxis sp. TaxID=1908224 RepID=UPI003D6D28DB